MQNETNEKRFPDKFTSELMNAMISWAKTMNFLEQCLCVLFSNKFLPPSEMKIFAASLTDEQKIHAFGLFMKKPHCAAFYLPGADNNFGELKMKLHYAWRAHDIIARITQEFLMSPHDKSMHTLQDAPKQYSESYNRNLELLKKDLQLIDNTGALLADFINRAENAKNPPPE